MLVLPTQDWRKSKTLKTDQVNHSDDEDSSVELIAAEELFYSGKTHLTEGFADLNKDKINRCKSQPFQESSRKLKVQREIPHQDRKNLLGFDHKAFVLMPNPLGT